MPVHTGPCPLQGGAPALEPFAPKLKYRTGAALTFMASSWAPLSMLGADCRAPRTAAVATLCAKLPQTRAAWEQREGGLQGVAAKPAVARTETSVLARGQERNGAERKGAKGAEVKGAATGRPGPLLPPIPDWHARHCACLPACPCIASATILCGGHLAHHPLWGASACPLPSRQDPRVVFRVLVF